MGKSKRTTPLILDGLTCVVTESELGSFSLWLSLRIFCNLAADRRKVLRSPQL